MMGLNWEIFLEGSVGVSENFIEPLLGQGPGRDCRPVCLRVSSVHSTGPSVSISLRRGSPVDGWSPLRKTVAPECLLRRRE